MSTHLPSRKGGSGLAAGFAGLASMLFPLASPAVLFIDVGDVPVHDNRAGLQFELYVSNTGDSAIEVAALIFNLQVADSGPSERGGLGSIAGPAITAVDIVTGTIFAGNNTLQHGGAGSLQFANASVTTGSGTVSFPPNSVSLLATVTVDSAGFASPGMWELRLGDTVNGATRFLDELAVSVLPMIQNGHLVAVPEPAQMGATLAAGALAFAAWRRVRRVR